MQAESHLEVTKEHSLYRKVLDSMAFLVFTPPRPAEKGSRQIQSHHSFDMAQQVFHPLQPTPCTSQKYSIFGVTIISGS